MKVTRCHSQYPTEQHESPRDSRGRSPDVTVHTQLNEIKMQKSVEECHEMCAAKKKLATWFEQSST